MPATPVPLPRLLAAAIRCAAVYDHKDGIDGTAVCGERSVAKMDAFGDCQWGIWRDDGLTWIVFRGTDGLADMLADAEFMRTRIDVNGARAHVHSGAWHMLDRAWPQIRATVIESITHGRRVVFAGHSLGAMLATMAAARLGVPNVVAGIYLVASPRPGNADFVQAWPFAAKTWRVSHDADWIDDVPPLLCGYRHVPANVVWIDSANIAHYPPPRWKYIVAQFARRLGNRTKDHYVRSYINALENLKVDP